MKRPRQVVSYNMSRIRSRGTKPEAELEALLISIGIDYVAHPGGYGHPDFVYPKSKIALFADSSFWHGYDWEKLRIKIKTNQGFWEKKIERTISRDREITKYFEDQGWKVIRFWDFELHEQADKCRVIINEAVARALGDHNDDLLN